MSEVLSIALPDEMIRVSDDNLENGKPKSCSECTLALSAEDAPQQYDKPRIYVHKDDDGKADSIYFGWYRDFSDGLRRFCKGTIEPFSDAALILQTTDASQKMIVENMIGNFKDDGGLPLLVTNITTQIKRPASDSGSNKRSGKNKSHSRRVNLVRL